MSKTCAIFQYSDSILSGLNSFIDTLSEEPDKSLEEAANKHIRKVVDAAGHPGWDWTTQDITDAFIAGAKWEAEQFEKNRLSACDALTKEEYDREVAFSTEIIEKEHRQPTFTDAINYGMRVQKQQMLKDAVEGRIGAVGLHNSIFIKEPEWAERLDRLNGGDKVRIVIVKED